MSVEGPDLESLVRRLAGTPPEFTDEPRIGGSGRVAVAAVVNDLLYLHGARAPHAALAPFEGGSVRADRNRLALVLIIAWLLADDGLRALDPGQPALLDALAGVARELAAVPAHRYVDDAERREELARTVVARLGCHPYGETPEQAGDRLAAVSAAERRRLLDASRAAERRAREIREALVRKAAEESADKWTRE
ncbi:hypothetical protein GPY61_07485 [Massilia sp. NEAU-DD11]|uniref:Uncharacterized protein n=1 Tax=Massilia cellulosiltytica TaxID=2683234 RepID=A0A7X3FXD2_9BURK|nr:hypothetical protein [Telluria cellulosilytica]